MFPKGQLFVDEKGSLVHIYASICINMHLYASESMSKLVRHRQILELIDEYPIYTQEELRKKLAHNRIEVNQATLSRDLRELGLIKTAEGYRPPPAEETANPSRPPVAHLIREFVREVKQAGNLLVLKTTIGSAQPVAVALDNAGWEENVGTIGGDDTILLIASTPSACHRVADRIREIIET